MLFFVFLFCFDLFFALTFTGKEKPSKTFCFNNSRPRWQMADKLDFTGPLQSCNMATYLRCLPSSSGHTIPSSPG